MNMNGIIMSNRNQSRTKDFFGDNSKQVHYLLTSIIYSADSLVRKQNPFSTFNKHQPLQIATTTAFGHNININTNKIPT